MISYFILIILLSDMLVTVSVQNIRKRKYPLIGSNANLRIPAVNIFPLCFTLKEMNIYFVRNCEGITCFIIADLLLLFSVLIFIFFIASADSWIRKLIIIPTVIASSSFALISHVKSMITNPGTTEIDSYSPQEQKRLLIECDFDAKKCNKCVALKLPGTSHCSVCNRCISEMDHHCPWINNCVGEKNMKYFLLYNFYINITCVIVLIEIFINSFYGIYNIESDVLSLILTLPVGFLSLLFSLFTTIMLTTTLQSLYIGETYIEKLKKVRRKVAVKGMKKIYLLFPGIYHLIPISKAEIKSFSTIFIN